MSGGRRTLKLDSKPSELALCELRGKVALRGFWATSCAVCVKEIPGIADTHARLESRGLVVVRAEPPA